MDAYFAYKPEGVQPSCKIETLPIYCQGEMTTVSVWDSRGVNLLEETMWADKGGVIKLHETGALIEQHFREQGLQYDIIELRTDSDRLRLPVVYCERESVGADSLEWMRENFLTRLGVRRVSPTASVPLWVYGEAGESLALRIEATLLRADGMYTRVSFVTGQTQKLRERGVEQLGVSVRDVQTRAASEAGGPGVLTGFTVRCGKRSMTCAVCGELRDAATFYFRNEFNVWDMYSLSADVTVKTETEGTTGVVGNRVERYNLSVTKSYESESCPLSEDEARWVDSFVSSHEVVKLERESFVPVIITESDCEMGERGTEPNRLRFTWRYAGVRPMNVLGLPESVFTRQFTPPFR